MSGLWILRVIFSFLLLFPILLFAQGQVFWQENGVCVFNGTFSGGDYTVSIVSDSCGGAIVLWSDTRGYQSSIYAQRIDKDGNCLWAPNGVLLRNDTWFPECLFATSDGKGGAITIWRDHFAGPYPRQITMQRIDSSGIVRWGPNGILIAGADRDIDYFPMIETDGRGGAIVGWVVANSENYYKDSVYVQRIDNLGQRRWTPGGILVSIDSGIYQRHPPSLTTDRYNGIIIVWLVEDESYNAEFYAQRVDSSGNILWLQGGIPVCTTSSFSFNYRPTATTLRTGNCLVSWCDARQFYRHVYAQLLDSNGQFLWIANGILICTDTGDQRWVMAIGTSNDENFILSWMDNRNGLWDIYAQKLNLAGINQWDSLGVRVGQTNYNEARRFSMTSDNKSGAIIVYQYWGTSGWDIYSQRIDSSGRLCWGDAGLAVCDDSTLQQWIPVITTDGVNGAIIAWGDDRPSGTNASVYAQLVGDVVGIGKDDNRLTLDCRMLIIQNPVKSVLRVHVPFLMKEIKIFDVSGKLIRSVELKKSINLKESEVKISLKGINPGIYFLKLGKETKKLIVTR